MSEKPKSESSTMPPSSVRSHYKGSVSLPDMLIDDSGFAWVGAGATRGLAVARCVEGLNEAGYDVRFTDFKALRVFGRLVPRGPSTKGWETDDFPDHFIEDCERGDPGASPYWEVKYA